MKINISGKGMIPGMGVLPPVYNVEKSETDVRRLINFRNIRVYCSENGLLITKKNVDSFFEVKPTIKETDNKSIDKNDSSVVQNDVVEDKSDDGEISNTEEIVDVVEESTVDESDDNNDNNTEPSVEKEECVDNKTEEDVTPVDEEINPTTAPVEEEQPKQTYSSKKKNRNKNRK